MSRNPSHLHPLRSTVPQGRICGRLEPSLQPQNHIRSTHDDLLKRNRFFSVTILFYLLGGFLRHSNNKF